MKNPKSFTMKPIILVLIVMAFILLPFFLFHDRIDAITTQLLEASGRKPLLVAALLFLLLAADIFLPVPSSLISIGCGFLLGFVGGTIVSFSAMFLACIIGYAVGKSATAKTKWLDADTRHAMEIFFQRYGHLSIIIARPIPVLAETSVFFAGISKMNFKKFMFLSSLSNLGISLMYAAIGAYAFSINSMMLAFAGALLLPGLALALHKIFMKQSLKGKLF